MAARIGPLLGPPIEEVGLRSMSMVIDLSPIWYHLSTKLVRVNIVKGKKGPFLYFSRSLSRKIGGVVLRGAKNLGFTRGKRWANLKKVGPLGGPPCS